VLTSSDFLRELQSRGATRVSRVRFRDNRSTVWSLTQEGTVLNVHVAYRSASPPLLDAFATLAIEGGVGSAASRRAARRVGSWSEVADAIRSARERHAARNTGRGGGRTTHCSATTEQREYIRALYRYFNVTRFAGRLPEDIPVRLSARMKSALGHMLPGEKSDGTRYVVEIALSIDLMLPNNGAERADTLLHEMAHVADYLESGGGGHGASWREWARRVGCKPTTLYHRPVQYRTSRTDRVIRVPPLPTGLADR
jgi:hypothetical protein